MKKILIALAAIAIGSQVAEAQLTNQVLSRNAVGYVKLTLKTNNLYLIRNDFVGLNAPIALSNAIGRQVPPGSQFLRFNEGTQTYLPTLTQAGSGSWGPGGSNILVRGQAYWIRMPAFNGGTVNSNEYQLFLMGEVPDSITAPTTSLSTVTGLNIDGYPYPTDARWTNTQYAKSVPAGTQLLIWNETNQTYNATLTKAGSGSWGPVGNALVIKPGQGFFVRATNVVAFGEAKPYTWP